MAERCFGVEVEGAAVGARRARRIDSLMERAGVEAIGADSSRASMWERLRFEFAAQDSAARRMGMLARWAFAPTLGDLDAVVLPAGTYPLYALIRPLRMLGRCALGRLDAGG